MGVTYEVAVSEVEDTASLILRVVREPELEPYVGPSRGVRSGRCLGPSGPDEELDHGYSLVGERNGGLLRARVGVGRAPRASGERVVPGLKALNVEDRGALVVSKDIIESLVHGSV